MEILNTMKLIQRNERANQKIAEGVSIALILDRLIQDFVEEQGNRRFSDVQMNTLVGVKTFYFLDSHDAGGLSMVHNEIEQGERLV